ncbi:hypothetical protein ACP26L_08355 [Paenibacillus sp. S-38]|uniref:hypothetical protein n=1 Tax=Paenibacillus sp. S-38 TaxID=3416710 RepID=UPI003CEE1B24
MDLRHRSRLVKVPPPGFFSAYMRAIGLLASGMIIGAALFLSIYNQRLNMVIVENRKLHAQKDELEGEIADLKKTKNQQTTINRLNVFVVSEEGTPFDTLTESELRKRVNSDLKKVVIGRKISDFAAMPEVYESILKEKPYLGVLDRDYMVLGVRWIVLTQTELKVWVTIKEWKRLPTP